MAELPRSLFLPISEVAIAPTRDNQVIPNGEHSVYGSTAARSRRMLIAALFARPGKRVAVVVASLLPGGSMLGDLEFVLRVGIAIVVGVMVIAAIAALMLR